MSSRGPAALALAALTLVPLAAANHVQTDSGNVIVFDHKGGNEWWVEVLLSGQDAGSVVKVEATDDGGPWVAMTYHPEWAFGDWAASFHIEQGHRVMFRASWSGGAQQLSCWFTHPDGVEQCGASGFQPTFTLVTGNEWWVQTQVTPNSGHTTATVDVRLNGGSWMPLKLQSWGVRAYAASYHIVDGTVVQFRATDTTGASGLSECYHWLPPQQNGATAAVVPCTTPNPAPAPTAFFVSNLKGNEWWIEAKASSKSPIAGLDTRVNGGPWVAMTLRDWDAWAVSTHAPPGSHVQFRARFPDGTFAFLPNGYVWTATTQWPPPSSTFDARFENTDHGNWNWVQVNVYASASSGLQAVSASVANGPYQPLKQQAWGDWAAPIRVENGSYVRFRADAPSGSTVVSGQYVWPSGRLVGAWPVEGSFASYHLVHGFGSPGGGYAVESQADLRITYHAGAWSGTCVGRTQESRSDSPADPYVVYHDYNWTADVHEGPPAAPAPPIVGSSYNFHPLEVSEDPSHEAGFCGHSEHISLVGPMTKVQTHLKDRDGRALSLPAWQAHHDPADYTPVADDLWWDTRLGLMLQWDHSQQDAGGGFGWMADTDAPIR